MTQEYTTRPAEFRKLPLWLCCLVALWPLAGFGQSSSLVISQLYGAGGNSGAKYQNDYVELFNRSGSAVSLSSYSIVFFTATGSTAASTLNLAAATIPAGGYYLVQLAGNAANGAALPAPDQAGTYNLGSTAGRVEVLLSGSLVDRVGYGSSATTYEGSGPAPAPSTATALLRTLGGCTDANSNDKDFATGVPAPRNAAAVGNNCTGPAPTIGGFSPAAGPVGSTITLSGSNFTSSATVTVGGVAAPAVACTSATALTVTVPGGAASGAIAVTTATGTATSADSYTVTVPVITVAPASLAGLVATQGSASPARSYQVSGSSLDGTALVVKASTTSLEVSLDGSTYAPSLSLPLGGSSTLGPTPVYVRVASGAALGSVSGSLANTNGAASSPVAASGAVVAPLSPKRWLGTAGTTSWFDAGNWEGGTLPGTGDDVVLDHRAVAGKYTVVLGGSGAAAVSVASLRLRPLGGDSILFVIPGNNALSSSNNGAALTLTRSVAGDTALLVGSRAFFTNASGASGGTVLDAAGTSPTVFLLNGGSYRHQTIRTVTSLLENLAGAAGTEAGNFYYRIPGTSSTTTSLAGRTYGNLIFQRPGATASLNYNASGNNPLTVNGTLTTESGVTLNYNLLANLVLRGNLVNNGAFHYDPNTTSTAASYRLVLQGAAPQLVAGNALADPAAGTGAQASYLSALVQLELSNPAGATLQLPLTLSNALVLSSGRLATDATNILTLGAAATVQGGSDASYVSGPVRRPISPVSSTSSFVFPVGKGGAYRPLTLTIASQSSTTVYRAEQFEGNATRPLAADSPDGTPLTRVSQLRYFTLTPFSADAAPVVTQPTGFAGTVMLSLGADDGVSDVSSSTLVVAKRADATQPWVNFGHGGHGGTAGAGTLTSGTISSFSDFALGSTDPSASANPLPVQLTQFGATRTSGGPVALGWATASELRSARFEVERSADGHRFELVATVAAHGSSPQAHRYASRDETAPTGRLYYRLRQLDTDGTAAYSPTVQVGAGPAGELALFPNPTRDQLHLLAERPLPYAVRTPHGQLALAGTTGRGLVDIAVGGLPAGVYFFELQTDTGRIVRRFTKE